MAAKSLISMAEWQWPSDIRYLASSPISHAAGFLLIPTFLNGGKVFLTAGFDPEQVLDLVEQERVNTLFLVPTMIYVLMDHLRTRQADLSSIESIIYASAPMSPTRLKEALELFGPVMMQCYGQTECIHLTMMRKEEHALDKPQRLASCGKPPAGVRMALLNGEGAEVSHGEIGEVCIRSQAVMAGYWERPEQTAETLRDGWLHTGDLAYQDDEGFYYLVDRAKDMIISGGFNVYPREVEDVLTAHPAVAMAAVIGVPDEKWGEKVVAVIVPRPGEAVDAGEMIALVKDKKGAIMAPKQVDFVASLPQTALGKTDKKALRKQYWGDQQRMVN
jgi:fatty-acyl-CoA synthase